MSLGKDIKLNNVGARTLDSIYHMRGARMLDSIHYMALKVLKIAFLASKRQDFAIFTQH